MERWLVIVAMLAVSAGSPAALASPPPPEPSGHDPFITFDDFEIDELSIAKVSWARRVWSPCHFGFQLQPPLNRALADRSVPFALR